MGAIAVTLLLAGGGATAAVTLLQDRGQSGPPWRPALENCFSLRGFSGQSPRLHPSVTIDDAGAATAVWVGIDGVVRAADRPAGEEWSEPSELSAPGRRPPVRATFAAAESGHAAAAWLADDRVWVTTRSPGGEWSEAESVSQPGRMALPQGSDAPALAVTERGDVALGWVSVAERDVAQSGPGFAITGRGPRAEIAVRPAGARWLAPRAVPGDGWLTVPALAASGEVFVAAALGLGPAGVLEVDADDGTLSAPRELRYPGVRRGGVPMSFGDPRVAARGTEAAVVMSLNGRIVLWTRRPDASWSAPRVVSQAAVQAADPVVKLSDDGRALVMWTGVTRERRADGTTRRARAVYATLSDLDRATEKPVRLSRAGRVASQPAGAITDDGALVVWADGTNGYSGRDSRIEVSWRPAAGTAFSRPQPLSGVGSGPLFPAVAVGAGGQAVSAWSRCVRPDSAVVEIAASEGLPTPGWSEATAISR